MAVQTPVRITQKVIVPLSAIMVLFACLSFVENHAPLQAAGGPAKLFTTSRMPTGEHFISFRQRTAPMWVYRGLHAVPAIIWSIAMPLQHVDGLRKRWPVFHRTAGYIILSISLLLSITGYWFFISKNAYTHQNPFHMHNFNGLVPFDWPTFELGTWLIAPFYWLTMYKTAVTARSRNFARHREWAVMHTICACVISAERLGVVILYAAGFALGTLPQDRIHEYFGVGHTVADMAEAELSMFAFANVIAVTTVLSWLAYEFGRAGYLDGIKYYLSSRNTDQVAAKKVE